MKTSRTVRQPSPALWFFLSAVACVPLAASHSMATTIYDESVSGDLTDFVEVDPWITSGTLVGSFSVGVNTVEGTFGTDVNNNRDSDVFTIQIPSGRQLDSIDLTYTLSSGSNGSGSYMSISGGTDLGTGVTTAGGNLDDAVVNTSGDLLAIFSSGTFTGITAPLAAGDYTIGFHEIGAVIDYTLDFNVSAVPEPATWLLGAGAALAFAGFRRRRPA